jgi:adenylosuccinate synthase
MAIGKGKMIDVLASKVQLCLRGQGGHNAGHTIVADGITYDFHLCPSGLLNPSCLNLVGSGCVVHVPSFFAELAKLKEKGLNTDDRIFLSDRAHVDLDLHQAVDGLEEVELGKESIGTTKKGIGPTFSSKATRSGVMLADVFDHEFISARLRRLYDGYKKRFGDLLKYDVEDEINRFKEYAEKLQPYVVDEVPLLRSAKEQKSQILVEGAQAIMLDVSYGTYPHVTSSNCSVGGILAGLSLDWRSVKEVIGVVKAYTTRVGSGPFPTEQTGTVGEKLQEIGREFGVTTGRRRRCGWLDLVVVKYGHDVNGYTTLNLTKLDILDDFDEIKVATSYSYNGQTLDSFPANGRILANIEVNYKTFPGWKKSTFGARTFDDLPPKARDYVIFIEEFVGVPVSDAYDLSPIVARN